MYLDYTDRQINKWPDGSKWGLILQKPLYFAAMPAATAGKTAIAFPGRRSSPPVGNIHRNQRPFCAHTLQRTDIFRCFFEAINEALCVILKALHELTGNLQH